MAKLWETLPQTPCLSQGLRQEIKRQDLHSHGGRDPAFFHFLRQKKMHLGLPCTVVQVLHFIIPAGIIFTLQTSQMCTVIMTIFQ